MDSDLRNMVMSFRVTELQTLLAYAGKNRSGRKNELQARALDLVKGKSPPVVSKIKELYRSMQQSMASTMPSATATSGSFGSTGNPRVYMGSSGYTGAAEKVLQGVASFLTYNGNQMKAPPPLTNMPICPDVKMKRLPFYDIQSELIKPTSLMPNNPIGRVHEITCSFCLTPQQAADIASSKELSPTAMGEHKLGYSTQCQLRFCALDTSCDQEDLFPPSICVKINGKIAPLPHLIPSNRPGIEAKRPSRPINVTNLVRLSPTMTNTVTVSWSTDNSAKSYCMSVYLVKKLSSSDLLQRLKSKGPRPADYSRGLIKELTSKDDGDCMIAMTSLKVTIACPLGKCRMSLPCRATTCKHLQCFDASLFLQMNERKPTWQCPVCDKPTLFEDLCIDGYFQEVIRKMPSGDSMEVELMPDGSWHPLKQVVNKKEKEDRSPPAKRMKPDTEAMKLNQTIDLDEDVVIEDDPLPSTSRIKVDFSDSEAEPKKSSNVQDKKSSGQPETIDLTLSDSEDEEEIPVVRPRRKTGNPKYVVDDSSSDSGSSTTTEGSAQTCPASPVAPLSPACITLDSRSPTPERQQSSNNGSSSSVRLENVSSNSGSASAFSASAGIPSRGNGTGPSSRSAAAAATGTNTRNEHSSRPNSSSTTTYDYGHTLGQPYPLSRSNSSQPSSSVPMSSNVYGYGQGYLPFDAQNMWGQSSSGSYNTNSFIPPTPTDFSHLDFSTMDQYRYDSTSRGNNGQGGGYGWN